MAGKVYKYHHTKAQIEDVLRTSYTFEEAAGKLGINLSSFKHVAKRLGVSMVHAKPAPTENTPSREMRQLKSELAQLLEQKARKQWRNRIVEKFDGTPLDPPKWLTPKLFKKTERTIASAFLSDVHADEVVNPAEINYVNGYNREIMTSRVKRFFDKTVQIDKHLGLPTDGMVLYLGGDMVSGNIHEELTMTNEAPILDTCLNLTELICAGIEMCLGHFGKVHVAGVTGNHGRLRHKPQAKYRAKDNFDWLIYKMLEKHFRQSKEVTFAIPEGSDAKVSVYGQRVQLTHGDQFRGGTGIAGLYSPISLGHHRKKQRETATAQPYDLLIMGHWHQLKEMGDIIINGSVKGMDEYAYQANFPFEPPQQAFWLTNQEGRQIQFARVYLDGQDEEWRIGKAQDAPGWMQ